jgi:chorismate-pyruvate lyase
MQVALVLARSITGAHVIRSPRSGLTLVTNYTLGSRLRALSMLTEQERRGVVAALGTDYPAWSSAPDLRAPDVPDSLRLPWFCYEHDDCVPLAA